MKIVTVIGARPQFIKAAVVSRLLKKQSGVEELLVHTGQHYDDNMSEVFFRELEIPAPAFHLGIGSGPHGQQTGRMLEAIEKVLVETKPDRVLVYGDTNSTLAGALAAVKLHIPIAHVEAGLRSFNRRMPEEINRIVTDHVSEWLFAPTDAAAANLRAEGRPEEAIHLVGDVMYDAAIDAGRRTGNEILEKLKLKPKSYLLTTIHRAENTDDPVRLHNILKAFHALNKEWQVVLPLHPRTRALLQKSPALANLAECLRVLEPVGYLDMVALEKNARLIATDSGGVQKEAFFQRVPCVTLRDETEWVELVELGWNRVVPPSSVAGILAAVKEALHDSQAKTPPSDLYGGGKAGAAIVSVLASANKPG
ncbi:MAG: UDP-N-acetylglucosamine 2-epimerase (non-hydrolyzing) [Gemmataceae bacterium]|nr:UDP-N-acetylglucosamine 2-epimerase (non-hydrolyzing) [Gemmataceae bacterium]MCI0743727.1 UDP-N-acetylglucosamine 2-epimerase (non-hydrolyzing) [Gemmataceae bacterium]